MSRFAALDKKLREDTQFELVNIQEDLATTFVVVTHDQEEAMSIGSQIGVMDKGHLSKQAHRKSYMKVHSSKFLADFLGQVSFCLPLSPHR